MLDKRENGFAITALIAVIAVCLAVATSWFVYEQSRKKPSAASTSKASKTQLETADPSIGWRKYYSTFEKLSFKYPTSWKVEATNRNSGVTGADAMQITSPSGKVIVSWFSAVQGIGGACDSTIMPGTPVRSGELSPCPYWYVLDKQKLSGADLYYVAGIETYDGIKYSSWCALQPADGITKSEGNIGYLLFRGKNNRFVESGHDYGLLQAGLLCGTAFGGFGVQGLSAGTKAEATSFLLSSEMKQAKQILLSATY